MNYISSDIIPFFEVTPYASSLYLEVDRPLPLGKLTDDFAKLIQLSNLSITERIDEPSTGVLTIVDNSNSLDGVLRFGMLLKVTIGLKESESIRSNFFSNSFDEISGDKSRTIIFYIMNKKIYCADGLVTYRYILKQGDIKQNIPNYDTLKKTYGDIKKNGAYTYDVIKCLAEYMNDLKDADSSIHSYYISTNGGYSDHTFKGKFTRSGQGRWFESESTTNKTGIGFLQYMASKYKFNIYIQSIKTDDSKDGKSIIYLLDSDGYEKFKFQLAENSGRKGLYHKFNYGTYSSNIISVDFDTLNQELFSGGGKKASIDKNGQITISEEKNGKVIYYKINMPKIKKELKDANSSTQIINKLTEIASSDFATDWDRLKNLYFEPVLESPNTQTSLGNKSRGQVAKVKLAPNPLFQIGDMVDLGPEKQESLIPFSLRSNSQSDGYYKIISLEHTISGSGYEMDLEMAR